MSEALFSRSAPGGTAMVVLSTCATALVPSLARLSYDGGSNTLTVITLRSLCSVLFLIVLLRLWGQSRGLGRGPLLVSLAAGVAYGAMLYCYLGALHTLPANLVIIIFFCHPLLVGLMAAALGLERLTGAMLLCSLMALTGLVCSVSLAPEVPDAGGVMLAVGAMVALSVVILCNAAATRTAPTLPVLYHMMAGAALVLGLPLVWTGALALPQTPGGWVGLVGVALAATFGTIAFFAGMARIGAIRATLISNLQPVLGVVASYALLGERLGTMQAVGLLLVVGSILAMEWSRSGKAAAA